MIKFWKAITRKMRSFFHFEKPLMILEAIVFLIFAKLLLVVVPFSWLSRYMGELVDTPPNDTFVKSNEVSLISRAIVKANRNIPFETACYPQALAAKLLLKRRNLDSTVFIGVQKDDLGRISGHAWLKYGECVVTGKEKHETFNIIAIYK